MIRTIRLAAILLATASIAASASARERHVTRLDANGNLDALIARHAAANNVPESLVRRVIARESRGNPRVVSKGNYGLMQIKLATAKALGYAGDAQGLRDPNTNLTYGVKYLAGAYRAADGDHELAIRYFAAGYYDAAKRLRRELAEGRRVEADGNPQPPLSGDAVRRPREKQPVLAREKVPGPLVIVPAGAKAAQAR